MQHITTSSHATTQTMNTNTLHEHPESSQIVKGQANSSLKHPTILHDEVKEVLNGHSTQGVILETDWQCVVAR